MTIEPVSVTPASPLWRLGRAPEPWAWIDWSYAGGQRWDDLTGEFRTVYAAESAFGCFVETLAHFRPDPVVVAGLGAIVVDPDDAARFPSSPPGEVPLNWVDSRRLSSASVDGVFCDVTAASTIAALRPHFLETVARLGLPDFDAAAIKAARPRELTQRLASWLYRNEAQPAQLWDGVAFASRHGDELRMWAIFERPQDRPCSRLLSIQSESEIARSNPELRAAFALHGLTWAPRIG